MTDVMTHATVARIEEMHREQNYVTTRSTTSRLEWVRRTSLDATPGRISKVACWEEAEIYFPPRPVQHWQEARVAGVRYEARLEYPVKKDLKE
jgi:hypothetical protein